MAGIAGVAATGVLIAKDERRRRAYEPHEIRERLHARHAEAVETAAELEAGPDLDDAPR